VADIKLIPKDHGLGTRRVPLGKRLLRAYNPRATWNADRFYPRDEPIECLTPQGIQNHAWGRQSSHEFRIPDIPPRAFDTAWTGPTGTVGDIRRRETGHPAQDGLGLKTPRTYFSDAFFRREKGFTKHAGWLLRPAHPRAAILLRPSHTALGIQGAGHAAVHATAQN